MKAAAYGVMLCCANSSLSKPAVRDDTGSSAAFRVQSPVISQLSDCAAGAQCMVAVGEGRRINSVTPTDMGSLLRDVRSPLLLALVAILSLLLVQKT